MITKSFPDSKVHGAYMGSTWGRQDPGISHVSPMNLAIRDATVPEHIWDLILHYCQISNTWHTLVGNKTVDPSDVVGASPVDAALTTSSFLT